MLGALVPLLLGATQPPATSTLQAADGAPAAVSDACPHGHFYAYRETFAPNSTEAQLEEETFAFCGQETFHCTHAFVERMLAHPCRTETIDSSTRAVAILHTLSRCIGSCVNPTAPYTTIGDASNRAFNFGAELLGRVPREVREHPNLYMFAGGEAIFMDTWITRQVLPQQATIFLPEPLWAQFRPYGHEPPVPLEDEACYLYSPSTRYAAVPYWQPSDQTDAQISADLDRPDAERSQRIFHFASMHGLATLLRSRLYDLCEPHAGWLCPRESTAPDAGHVHGRQPLSQSAYVRAVGSSTFVLIPAGDTPGRITMWDALRRGAVPVLFSSCPHAHPLDSHRGWLPADEGSAFGVRSWAVLLNQTAVMTSETYLRDALAAVTAEQLASMRAAVRPYLTRLSYHGGAELDRGMDALDLTVEHMLRREKGYPAMTSTRIPEALRPARAGWPGPTALSA